MDIIGIEGIVIDTLVKKVIMRCYTDVIFPILVKKKKGNLVY